MFNKAPAMIADEVNLVRARVCVCVKKCTKWCDATQTDEGWIFSNLESFI